MSENTGKIGWIDMTVEDAIAGVCHARGSNADLAGGWLIYVTVVGATSALYQP
jgi:hypothetical protein